MTLLPAKVGVIVRAKHLRFRIFGPIQVLNAKVLWFQFANVVAGGMVMKVSRCVMDMRL